MKDIIIVCAGCYGLEVYSVINDINRVAIKNGQEKVYNILGFIDDNSHALDGYDIDAKIIGGIKDWQPKGDEVYAIGAAFPKVKEKLSTMLKARGCRFETLVAPWSNVSRFVNFGEGCFVTAYEISAGVTLGNFVNINGSAICSGAKIGDFSTTTGFTVVENATVGKRVFIGSHAVILSGIVVEDDSEVSVGSIVTDTVKAGTNVFGVPAKPYA